jgi:hypothetical protein
MFEAIHPSSQDRLTSDTARQILTHNRRGAERCGWEPLR